MQSSTLQNHQPLNVVGVCDKRISTDYWCGSADMRGKRERALPDVIAGAGLFFTSAHSIWIMLATCCRVGELSGAAWADVDLEAKQWRIPPENSKNGKAHLIDLSDFAIRQIEAIKTLTGTTTNDQGETVFGKWVLPAKHNDGPVCSKSLAKQIGDRQRDGAPMNSTRPHDDAMVELLREDAAFAEEYLAASLEAIDEPGGREAQLMALRQVAQAQGMDAVAERAGMQRESLYRALSPKGNLTLKTLLAILNGAGLRLTVTRTSPNPGAGDPLITPNSSIARRTIMSDNESHER